MLICATVPTLCKVLLSAETYSVVMVLSSGFSSFGIASTRDSIFRATGSFTP